MKRCCKGFLIALGMFSVVPVPYFDWDDDSMGLVMPCLPLVGAVVGGFWCLGAWLLGLWNPPLLLHGALLALLPVLLTGMLHLDGFMDTMDAVLSCRDRAERLRILKDPQMGALGTAAFGILLLFQFCAGVALAEQATNPLIFVFIPIFSRLFVTAASAQYQPISATGYMATFHKPRGTAFRVLLATVVVVLTSVVSYTVGLPSLIPLLVLGMVAVLATLLLKRQFGGISGDLCGCIITVSELAAMLTLALLVIC